MTEDICKGIIYTSLGLLLGFCMCSEMCKVPDSVYVDAAKDRGFYVNAHPSVEFQTKQFAESLERRKRENDAI